MIAKNLQSVRQQIQHACHKHHRHSEEVTLVAVSKYHAADKIRQAYAAKQRHFAENYVKEALEKQALLTELTIIWHFIGHIQSNKTRKIAEQFDWAHTVDSLKIAQRLSDQRPKHLDDLNICLQINIDAEDSKAGILPDTKALIALATSICTLPRIKLRGLMCIPAPKSDSKSEYQTFRRMVALNTDLINAGFNVDTLSMGMSADIDTAIACGSTMVRVGTAIFGTRH